MATYRFIEKFPYYESEIAEKLTTYMHNEVEIQKIYPNFGTLRIDETHPAALLNVALDNSKPVPTGIFPSITVNTVEDNPGEATSMAHEDSVEELDVAWVDEFLVGNPEALQSQVTALRDLMVAEDRNVFSITMSDRIAERILYAIWAESRPVKNTLYAHLRGFMFQYRDWFISQLGFENWNIFGTPGGLYNMDFGRVLHGAEVAVLGQKNQSYLYIDTSWLTIKEVEFYYESISSP